MLEIGSGEYWQVQDAQEAIVRALFRCSWPIVGSATVALQHTLALGMQTKVYVDQRIVKDTPEDTAAKAAGKSQKKKAKGSWKDTMATLRESPKIMNLALLVVCYALAHRLFEFAWKGQLRVLFPTAQAYSGALADVSIYTGAPLLPLPLSLPTARSIPAPAEGPPLRSPFNIFLAFARHWRGVIRSGLVAACKVSFGIYRGGALGVRGRCLWWRRKDFVDACYVALAVTLRLAWPFSVKIACPCLPTGS